MKLRKSCEPRYSQRAREYLEQVLYSLTAFISLQASVYAHLRVRISCYIDSWSETVQLFLCSKIFQKTRIRSDKKIDWKRFSLQGGIKNLN